jgi:hypothetical protein
MTARYLSLLFLDLALTACANPHVRSPEAGISIAVA